MWLIPNASPLSGEINTARRRWVVDNAEQGGTLPHTVLITSFLTGVNLPGRALKNASTHVHQAAVLLNNKHSSLVKALQLQQLHPPKRLCLRVFYEPVYLRADPGDASCPKSQIQREQSE